MEQHGTYAHNGHRIQAAAAQGFLHPFPVPGAVVVAHDGHSPAVEAEYRHEYKGLQLEIYPQYADGGGRKGDEDLVHAKVGHRADGLHHDAGQAYPVDLADKLALGPEAPELHLDKAVVLMQVIHAHQHAQQLAQHRGDGGARHPQLREAQQAENEDGIEDDVENGAGKLGKHGVEGIPGRLQDLFKHALENEENTGHPYVI